MPTIVQPRVLPADLEERWNAVQRSEILRTDVPDYRTYNVRTALGLSAARAGLKEEPVRYSREAIREFHATAFGSTVTDAGNFRTRMVQIHPFTDGNGRTARAFMAAEASQEFGVDSEKVMEAIEADRDGYIKAISQTSGQVVFPR